MFEKLKEWFRFKLLENNKESEAYKKKRLELAESYGAAKAQAEHDKRVEKLTQPIAAQSKQVVSKSGFNKKKWGTWLKDTAKSIEVQSKRDRESFFGINTFSNHLNFLFACDINSDNT